MFTVTAKLKPMIVLSHLLTGLSILSILWWAYLSLYFRGHSLFNNHTSPKKLVPWLWIGLIVVAIQITLGGWVSTHDAGLACVDFPYCNATLLPTMHWTQLNTDLVTIHMLHRIGAFITAIYLSLLAMRLSKEPLFRKAALVMISLLMVQITLGILNIIWLRPVWIALIHQSVAIFLLLSIIATLAKAAAAMEQRHDLAIH
jgi:cytochrome c oxidase assembly protein subunit 15